MKKKNIIKKSTTVTLFDEVKIGKQIWMIKNLDVTNFKNGDPIPEAKTDIEWEKAGKNKQPAWCYYDNEPANGTKYGKLYNWYAVNDPRGLAPVNWHIPSDDEWSLLTDYFGGEDVAGTKMKSTSGWDEDGNGTDEFDFCGLPGGSRNYNGEFDLNILTQGNWWSSSDLEGIITDLGDNGSDFGRNRYIDYSDGYLNRSYSSKEVGFYVRCLRD